MIDDSLTRFPGVYVRKDSGVYQFGLRVPLDLAAHYPGPWAVRDSLKTKDLGEANAKARQLQAHWAETFARQRAGMAPRALEPTQPTLDLGHLRTELLRRLEAMLDRIDAQAAAYTPDQRRERASEALWCRDDTRQGLECGYVPDWQVAWLDRMCRSLGVPRCPVFDSELLKHFVAMEDIRIEALTDHSGTYPVRVATLAARRSLLSVGFSLNSLAPSNGASALADGRKIADALRLWEQAEGRPVKTVEAFTRHAKMFADMTGDPAVGGWTKATARAFRDALTAWAERNGRTAATADNVMLSVRAIASVAVYEGWIAANPFAGVTVKKGGRESAPREPWTRDELALLFDDPIWSGKALPKAAKAGRAAAYWMPLIACYSGARISEVAQLWTDDFDLGDGSECFEIRENLKRQQKLKNPASWRAVPMHSELVRLGLPAYVKSLPLGPLFPQLSRAGKNGPGGVFGVWFGTYKAGKGFTTPTKAFHSFRHLVSTELQLLNVQEALRNSILGHTGEGMGERVYGATIRRQAQRLRQYVDLLDFGLGELAAVKWD